MSGLEHDLARWEGDLLTVEEVEARHPDEDVRGLVAVWMRLHAASEEPAPDPRAGWAALEARLESRDVEVERMATVVALRRPRASHRRVVALVAAAVLSVGAVAYAAAPDSVRQAVDDVASRIGDLFGGSDTPGDRDDRQPGQTFSPEEAEDVAEEPSGGGQTDDDGSGEDGRREKPGDDDSGPSTSGDDGDQSSNDRPDDAGDPSEVGASVNEMGSETDSADVSEDSDGP